MEEGGDKMVDTKETICLQELVEAEPYNIANGIKQEVDDVEETMIVVKGEYDISHDITENDINQQKYLSSNALEKTEKDTVTIPSCCDTCGKCFPNNSLMKIHLRTHFTNKPHECDTCGKCFTTGYSLRRHRSTIHPKEKSDEYSIVEKTANFELHIDKKNCEIPTLVSESSTETSTTEKTWKCETCGMSFPRSNTLLRHKKIHLGEKPFRCDFCGRSFREKYDLKKHIHKIHNRPRIEEASSCEDNALNHELPPGPGVNRKTTTNEKKLCCETCGKRFTRNSNLQIHIRSHTKEKPYECTTCGKSFAHKSTLQDHYLIHTGEKPWQCNTCGKDYMFRQSLIRHCKIHTENPPDGSHTLKENDGTDDKVQGAKMRKEEKLFHCDTCGKCFSKQSDFEVHLKTESHTGENPFKCYTCGICFRFFDSLTDHKIDRSADKPFTCDTCGKCFGRKSGLDYHTKIHRGDKNHKCDTCGKLFIEKRALILHERTHTGEKPYECNFCGRCFSTKRNLMIHERQHTGERPYKCNICEKNYTKSSDLQKHEKTHAGIKPYKCDICEKSFQFRSHFTEHQRRHAGIRPYICDICGKGSVSKSNLQTHLKTHKEIAKNEKSFTYNKNIERLWDKNKHIEEASLCNEREENGDNINDREKLGFQGMFDTVNESIQGYSILEKEYNMVHDDTHKRVNEPSNFKSSTEEPTHCCDICGESFLDLNAFTKHKGTHRVEKQDVTKDNFTGNRQMIGFQDEYGDVFGSNYENTIIKEEYDTDQDDTQEFDELPSGKDTETSSGAEEKLSCDNCGRYFINQSIFTKHSETCTVENPNECKTFEENLINSTNVEIDMKKHSQESGHTGEKPYECTTCGKSFAIKSYLQDHIIVHTGEKPWQCKTCGKRFEFCNSFKRHCKTHSENPEESNTLKEGDSTGDKVHRYKKKNEEKLWHCDTCGKCFSKKYDFEVHLKTESHTGDKPFKCDICGKFFANFRNLTNHKISHTGVKPYTCDICGKCFTRKAGLRIHTKIHTDDKDHECETCGKRFIVKWALIIHERTHVGQKPCKCDFCGRFFSTKRTLIRHKRQHTGERPYKCTHCKKSYTNSSDLQKHQKIHEGKLFECEFCERSFLNRRSLTDHRRLHTGMRPYVCSICSKGFLRRSSLGHHLKTHNEINTFERSVTEYTNVEKQGDHYRHREEASLCNVREDSNYDIDNREKFDTVKGSIHPNSTLKEEYSIVHDDIYKQDNVPSNFKTLTEESTHCCDICGKSFLDLNSFTRHRRTHTVEKQDEEKYNFTENRQMIGSQDEYIDDFGINYDNTVIKEEYDMDKDNTLEFNELPSGNDTETSSGAEEKLTCDNCERYFIDQSTFTKHKEMCTVETPMECSTLEENLINSTKIEIGTTFHVTEKETNIFNVKVKEETQDKILKHELPLGINTESPIEEEKLCCQTCGKVFSTNSYLQIHIQSHTGEKPYECTTCGKCFAVKRYLQDHFSIHTGEKPWQCNTCGKSYTSHRSLNRHCKIHHEENPEESDASKESDHTDEKVHSDNTPKEDIKLWHCDTCGKCFSKNSNFQVHLKTQSHTGDKPFKCDICGSFFAKFRTLINHKVSHTGDKRFTCDSCGKCFKGKSGLDYHTKIHRGDKKHKCETCGKGFIEKRALMLHERTHTGEKPYECYFCKRCFSTKRNLMIHERQHTGERPYKCDICQKTYTKSSDLQKHERTHAGIKPYKCDICEKSFQFRSHFTEHQRRHAGIRPYICDICGKGWVSKSNLQTHLKTHKGIAKNTYTKNIEKIWDKNKHIEEAALCNEREDNDDDINNREKLGFQGMCDTATGSIQEMTSVKNLSNSSPA